MLDTILSLDWTVILIALLAVSEALALVPGVKANSIFQLVVNVLRTIKEKLIPAPKQ
jgi:hypothetical protein